MKIQIKNRKNIDELSSSGGGAVQGHVNYRKEDLKEELHAVKIKTIVKN